MDHGYYYAGAGARARAGERVYRKKDIFLNEKDRKEPKKKERKRGGRDGNAARAGAECMEMQEGVWYCI